MQLLISNFKCSTEETQLCNKVNKRNKRAPMKLVGLREEYLSSTIQFLLNKKPKVVFLL